MGIKGVGIEKKHKSKNAKTSIAVHHSPSKAQDPSVNVTNDSHHESLNSGDVFRWKKLKLTPSQSQMHNMTHTAVSQKTLVLIGATVGSPIHTPTHHSDTMSVSVSSHHGDTPPIGSQVDPIGSSHPKVPRASHLHFF